MADTSRTTPGMSDPDWRRRRREVIELRAEAIALRERLCPRRTRLERRRQMVHNHLVRI